MRISLLILTVISGFFCQGQIALNQFYRSDFIPDELNISSQERIIKIHDEYIKTYNLPENELDAFALRNNYYLEKLNKSGQIFYGDEITNYLNSLKDLLLQDDERKSFVHVYLVNFPQINAFTNDYGNIYVNIGTIAKLESEEQLLTVLAHEISHILLRHTLKNQQYVDSLQNTLTTTHFEELETHLFNQQQELQADSMAYTLLKSKNINLSGTARLFEQLSLNYNPIHSGNVDLSLLTNRPFVLNKLEEIYTADLLKQYKYSIIDTNSINKSTHPTIEERIKQVVKFGSASDSNELRLQGDFLHSKELAEYVYVNTLMTSGYYVDGLYHTLKLLEKNPNDVFLQKAKVKYLLLLTQQKYRPEFNDQVLNVHGNECNSDSYHAFRKFVLSLSPVDMNIIACVVIEDSKPESNPYLDHLLMVAYQFLYKNNPTLFKAENANTLSFADFETLQKYDDLSWSLERMLTKEEQNLVDELTRKGYEFIKTQSSIALFGINYAEELTKSTAGIQPLLYAIDQYKDKRRLFEGTLTLNDFPGTLDPIKAQKIYKHSSFENRVRTDTVTTKAFVESLSFCLESRNKRISGINLQETLKLEEAFNKATSKNHPFNYNLSSSTGGVSRSVSDNYNHFSFLNWMQESFTLEDLNFSTVDEEIWSFRNNNSVDYLAFNINVAVRNRGTGNRYYAIYYDLYIDMETGGIVYVSKIPTHTKPTKKRLRFIQYVSNNQNPKKK